MDLNQEIYEQVADEFYQNYLDHIEVYTNMSQLDEKESNALILETMYFYYINNPVNYNKNEFTEKDRIVMHLCREGTKKIKNEVDQRPLQFKMTLYELLKTKIDSYIKSH